MKPKLAARKSWSTRTVTTTNQHVPEDGFGCQAFRGTPATEPQTRQTEEPELGNQPSTRNVRRTEQSALPLHVRQGRPRRGALER